MNSLRSEATFLEAQQLVLVVSFFFVGLVLQLGPRK
jgi:hypothetical protein